ncbi:WW domain-containing protein [Entamoeba marina]
MKIDVFFVNYGVIGEVINGYVEVTFKKPTFVRQCKIMLRSHTCCPELKSKGETDPRFEENFKDWEAIKEDYGYQVINADTYNEHYQVDEERYTEYPPGITRFPFEFKTPDTFGNTVVVDKNFLKWEAIATIIDDFGNETKSSPVECPLLYSRATAKPQPVTFEETHLKYSIVVNVDNNEVYQGEVITGSFTFTNRTNVPLYLTLFLTSVVSTTDQKNGAMDKQKYPENVIEAPPGISTFHFSCRVSHLHYPNVFADPFVLRNFIEIDLDGVTFETKKEATVVVPITVYARPCDKDLMLKYGRYMGYRFPFSKRTFYGIHKSSPPACSFVEDLEQIYLTDSNKALYIDHFSRQIYGDFARIDKLSLAYPLELSTLPQGWTMGYYKNERYYIDLKTKKSTWVDPRNNPIPEHAEKNIPTTLSILPICAEGVGTGIGLKLKVMGGKKTFKFSVAKGLDPSFTAQPVRVTTDNWRNNVMVYIYEKKNLLGVVDIDLTFLQLNTSFKKWYYLTCPEYQQSEYMGRIKLQITYATPGEFPKVKEELDYFSALKLPFYNNTPRFIDAVKEMNIVRKNNMLEGVMTLVENQYIAFDNEAYLVLFKSLLPTLTSSRMKRRNTCPPEADPTKLHKQKEICKFSVKLKSFEECECSYIEACVEPKKKIFSNLIKKSPSGSQSPRSPRSLNSPRGPNSPRSLNSPRRDKTGDLWKTNENVVKTTGRKSSSPAEPFKKPRSISAGPKSLERMKETKPEDTQEVSKGQE